MESKNTDKLVAKFITEIDNIHLPSVVNPYLDNPPEIAQIAAKELQNYLENLNDVDHNFGLDSQNTNPIIGKMFGVLVVKDSEGNIGYLSAFSGKLGGSNVHDRFVPPIYDMLSSTGFITDGMMSLKQLSDQIEKAKSENLVHKVQALKKQRANLSKHLQSLLFEEYHIMNDVLETKNIVTLFKDKGYKQPPSAAGECAAPKLLQYAFQMKLKPIAIAEFWWGLSPKSDKWRHKEFYPACESKCRPILSYMLGALA
tara:strand:+ start:27761 stop:28528 length:768 start_codon:yes stop_codon:yes gene_type:complete